MGREVLKKFDRYFLLDCIAQGGMAEIFRARLASKDGASRLLVIKRILAGHGKNVEFHSMFRSEIKVMMGFNHPNIVQLYDFGEVESKPYIAMEFVDGKNLRHYINRYTKKKRRFPIDIGAYVIEQAAAGLHYAHFFKDKITGEPLHIVHRDVSPQNILVSYDGGVKVIDFGIAKARTNVESTRVGIIKGKPSYLSPEQITGEQLDARSDVFSLGAVLWEVLTGKKLFSAPSGENEFAVLKMIESCDNYVKPPSTLNPDVPKELDAIVMKSLVKQREKRYQTAEEFQRALHKFIYQNFQDFNPSDLTYQAKSLFKDQIIEDRKMLMSLNGKVEQLLESEISNIIAPETSNTGDKAMISRENSSTFIDERKDRKNPNDVRRRIDDIKSVVNEADVEVEGSATQRRRTGERPRSPEPPRKPSSKTGVTEHKNLYPKTNTRVHGAPGAPPREITHTGTMTPQSTSRRTEMYGSKQSVFKGGKLVAMLALAAGIGIYFMQPDWLKKFSPDTPTIESTDAKIKKEDDSQMVLLKLEIDRGFGKAQITINGTHIDESNPVARVPLGSPLELYVFRQKYKPFRREFVLDPLDFKDRSSHTIKVNLEPKKSGILSVYSTPSADVMIQSTDPSSKDSKPWEVRTPFVGQRVPAGVYQIRLENKVLGMEKEIVVEVKEGQQVYRDEKLEIKPEN